MKTKNLNTLIELSLNVLSNMVELLSIILSSIKKVYFILHERVDFNNHYITSFSIIAYLLIIFQCFRIFFAVIIN